MAKSEQKSLASELARQILEIVEREDIPAHDAWPKVAAEALGYEPSECEFIGQNDGGVDFIFVAQNHFSFFQCKMHELDPAGFP